MMKKILISVLTLTMVLVLVVLTQTPLVAAEEKVSLSLWHWQTSTGYVNAFNQIIKTYEEQHPNITIEQRSIAYAEYNMALKVALSGGEPPDVFEIHPGSPSVDLAAAEQILDMTEIIKGDKEWMEWTGDVLNYREMYIGGRIYYAPTTVNHLAVFYYKDMFTKRGLAPPETVDELIKMVPKFKKDEIVPISVGFQEQWSLVDTFTVLVQQIDPSGDIILRANSGEVSWEDPIFKQAAETIVRIHKAGVWPEGSVSIRYTPDALETFVAKKAAMFWPVGEWYVSALPEEDLEKDNIGELPFPKITADAKTIVTGGVAVNLTTHPDNPRLDVVLDFIKFTNSPIAQEAFFDNLAGPVYPVKKSSDVPLFNEINKNQHGWKIDYRYIDNPDINKAVAVGLQKALLGTPVNEILADIEKVSREVNSQ